MTTDPYDAAGPERGLDPAGDPDRFDPARDEAAGAAAVGSGPVGPLDPALDPDRYANGAGAQGRDLTELIGKERSFEEERDGWTWVLGLLAVFAFLALASLVLANLSPR